MRAMEGLRNMLKQETGAEVYINHFPLEDEGAPSLCVSEYGGAFPGGINYGVCARRVQIAARAARCAEAEALAEQVFHLLDSGGEEEEIDLGEPAGKIISRPRHTPLFIEEDKNGRAVFGVNFVIHGAV